MRPSLTAQFNHRARATVPGLMALFLVILGVMPLGLPNFESVSPIWTLPAVYYWSVHRPDLMPAPLAFVLGLLHDMLNGGPLGLMALVLLFVQAICVNRRREVLNEPFLIGWLGFVVVSAGAHLAVWLLASLYFVAWQNFLLVLIQFAITVSFYPPMALLFGVTQGWIARAELE